MVISKHPKDLKLLEQARFRLKFEELFFNQLKFICLHCQIYDTYSETILENIMTSIRQDMTHVKSTKVEVVNGV